MKNQKLNSTPIINSVPNSHIVQKLEIRKEIKENLSEPKNANGKCDNNKSIPRSQPTKPLVPNQMFRKTIYLGY